MSKHDGHRQGVIVEMGDGQHRVMNSREFGWLIKEYMGESAQKAFFYFLLKYAKTQVEAAQGSGEIANAIQEIFL